MGWKYELNYVMIPGVLAVVLAADILGINSFHSICLQLNLWLSIFVFAYPTGVVVSEISFFLPKLLANPVSVLLGKKRGLFCWVVRYGKGDPIPEQDLNLLKDQAESHGRRTPSEIFSYAHRLSLGNQRVTDFHVKYGLYRGFILVFLLATVGYGYLGLFLQATASFLASLFFLYSTYNQYFAFVREVIDSAVHKIEKERPVLIKNRDAHADI